MASPERRIDRRDTAAILPGVLQFMQLPWVVLHGFEKTSQRMAGDLGVTNAARRGSVALAVAEVLDGVSAWRPNQPKRKKAA